MGMFLKRVVVVVAAIIFLFFFAIPMTLELLHIEIPW
jgi:hypothetical protein